MSSLIAEIMSWRDKTPLCPKAVLDVSSLTAARVGALV
jgi:hypothetical protein